MLNLQFKRDSLPIDDEDLTSVIDAIRPILSSEDHPEKDMAILLARMMSRIHKLQSTLNRVRSENKDLLTALQAIITETMDYPPVAPYSADSYLPAHLIEQAQAAISQSNCHKKGPAHE